MAQNSFLGKGMKFPPQINPATGRFEVSQDVQSIKESIYLILMTQKTERYVRPEYGASLMRYTFMDTGVTALSIMARELANDISTQEPRINHVNVEIDSETKKGCLLVDIQYQIIATNTRDNLVFPFYLNTTFEEDEIEYEEE